MDQYTHDNNPGPGSYHNPQTNPVFNTPTAATASLLSNIHITEATTYPDLSNEMEDYTYTSNSAAYTSGETIGRHPENPGLSSTWDLSSRSQITPEIIAARVASCKRRRDSTALPAFMLPNKKQRSTPASSGNDQNGRRRNGYRRRVLQPSSITSRAHGAPPQIIRQGRRSRARGRRRVVMKDGKVMVLRLRRGRPAVHKEADPEVDIMAGDIMKMGI